MTPRQLLRECDSHELSELQAWTRLNHLGVTDDDRADFRSGIVASVVANVHRDDKVKPDPFEPSDFIPTFFDPDEDTGSAVNIDPAAFSALMHALYPQDG